MHVREAAAIRYGLKNLGFAPGGEAGRLITNGMSRSAMRFPLAARDVVWNRCDLAVRHGICRRSAIHGAGAWTPTRSTAWYGKSNPVDRDHAFWSNVIIDRRGRDQAEVRL